MKNKIYLSSLALITSLGLQSCAVVGGIFKAGAATGIFFVVAIVVLIVVLITRLGKK